MPPFQNHELETDILVAGGGPAGVPCALAAARNGARVILCQDRSVLGGNASSEVRMHIVGADQHGARGRGGELAVETREGGIIEEIRLTTAVNNPQRCANMLDLIFYDKIKSEPHIDLMLNTRVTDAVVKDGQITHAIALRASTEDQFKIAAKIYIDCTGDGGLGVAAGASFRHGREAKAEFNEKYARDVADKQTLGSSLLFTATKHPAPVPFTAPNWSRKFTKSHFKHRPISKGSYEYGFWWVEWGGQFDTLKDNEKIRDGLLAILMGVWDYIKNSGDHPESANWALNWFGFYPGKRESRRFIGQHVLKEDDLLKSTRFDDAIAYGGWKIDIHPPSGVDVPNEPPFTPHDVPHVYDIPLRCCVSKELPNLMFAGRNISATHVAFASTRVMATCAVIGEGVGTSAAFALKHRLLPNQLAANSSVMKSIQQQLLRQGAYLIGIKNEDPKDLARSAKVTASRHKPNGEPANLLTGQTRSVHGKKGAPPDRSHPGTHRWMSDPAEGFPAWIELRWDTPITPREIQLTFDTGMHRELTLSQSDHATRQQLWGRAQPETVRDYFIEAEVNGSWTELVKTTNNYLRRVVHKINPSGPVIALKVTVLSTNGLDHARIFEIRAYES